MEPYLTWKFELRKKVIQWVTGRFSNLLLLNDVISSSLETPDVALGVEIAQVKTIVTNLSTFDTHELGSWLLVEPNHAEIRKTLI